MRRRNTRPLEPDRGGTSAKDRADGKGEGPGSSLTTDAKLCDSEKVPYLTVKFDAPLFGVWSPVGKNAPFICIEPWYGRCDSVRFDGSFEEREWGSELLPNTSFQTAYTVSV